MSFQSVYKKLNCRHCAEEEEEFGKIPKCKRDGDKACPISSGEAPALTHELAEVVDVYNWLANPLISQVSALQQVILQHYVAPKTEEGLVFFLRMLCAYHEINEEFYKAQRDTQDQIEGHAKSKGRE